MDKRITDFLLQNREVYCKYRCHWQGFDVYALNQPFVDLGFPRHLLVNKETIRHASYEENRIICKLDVEKRKGEKAWWNTYT